MCFAEKYFHVNVIIIISRKPKLNWVNIFGLLFTSRYLGINREGVNFFFSLCTVRMIKSRRTSLTGQVGNCGKPRKPNRISDGRLNGMKPFERHRRRWVNNIKRDIKISLIKFDLAQDKAG
jgi:hypothetical protein